MYDGLEESDVTNFPFMYENVLMHGKADEENAGSVLDHLGGAIFDF